MLDIAVGSGLPNIFEGERPNSKRRFSNDLPHHLQIERFTSALSTRKHKKHNRSGFSILIDSKVIKSNQKVYQQMKDIPKLLFLE